MDRRAWQAMVHGVAKSQTPQTTNIHDVKHLFMWLFDLYILFMKCLNAFYPLSNWIVFFLIEIDFILDFFFNLALSNITYEMTG